MRNPLSFFLAASLLWALPAQAAPHGNFLLGHWRLAGGEPVRCQGVPAITFTPSSHTIFGAGTRPLVPLSESVRYAVSPGRVTLLDRRGQASAVSYRAAGPGRMQDGNGCMYRRG